MTGVQLEASAHAPCTRTMVGLGPVPAAVRAAVLVAGAAVCALALGVSVNADIAATAAAAVMSPATRGMLFMDSSGFCDGGTARPASGRARVQDWARACLMKAAARSGWAMKAVCEPSISSVTEFIRLAMNSCAWGGIALSCRASRYQEGMVLQSVAVAF